MHHYGRRAAFTMHRIGFAFIFLLPDIARVTKTWVFTAEGRL
jgi:hypothetical protein